MNVWIYEKILTRLISRKLILSFKDFSKLIELSKCQTQVYRRKWQNSSSTPGTSSSWATNPGKNNHAIMT